MNSIRYKAMVYTCRLNPHILVHNPCMPAGWARQDLRIICVQRVEHPYIVRKSEKSLDIVSPPSMLRKLHMTSSKPKF